MAPGKCTVIYLTSVESNRLPVWHRVPILVQVTIYRRLRSGRDGHLDHSEANDIS